MLNMEVVGQARKWKQDQILQIPICLGSQASGRLFPTSWLRFVPKSVGAQFLVVNRLPALPSQPALSCRFPQLRVWREENVSPCGRPAYSPTIAQESTQRALVSITLGFAFLMKILISHFIICCFCYPWFILCRAYLLSRQKEHSQILFECRIQQPIALSNVQAYSSSPHIPHKSFAFY